MTQALGSICDLISVQVDPQSTPNTRYIGLEHVDSSRFVLRGSGLASEVQSSKFIYKRNDILYGKLRPYLDKAVLADSDGVCTTELLVLRSKPGVDPRFLICVVHSHDFIQHAMSGITGAHHPRTSWQRISEFLIPNFLPEEQSAIADLIWRVHDCLSLTEKAIAGLEELKRAAMREVFARGLHGEKQKLTEVGLIPERWQAGRLDRYAAVISTSMSYSELEAAIPSVKKEAVLVLGVKVSDMNLCGNEMVLHRTTLQKPVDSALAERRCAPPLTILFPKRGAAIATNKKRLSSQWTVFDPNIIGVRSGPELDQHFLFQWFQNFDLRTITEAGPTPQLNKKNLDPLLIPVPPTLDEQQEITAVLDAVDRRMESHRQKQRVLQRLFNLVLHQLVTGEVRLSEAKASTFETIKAAEVSA